MAKYQFLLLLPLSFLLLSSLHPSASASTSVGGWTPIHNLTDPHLKELGGFAVAEHDRVTNDQLEFVKVVSGEQQVVNGINYRLVLEVKDGNGKVVRCQAVVWEKAGSRSMQLTSFNRI